MRTFPNGHVFLVAFGANDRTKPLTVSCIKVRVAGRIFTVRRKKGSLRWLPFFFAMPMPIVALHAHYPRDPVPCPGGTICGR